MRYRTRNQAATSTLTATRPTAFTGRKWVRWTLRMKAEFLDRLAATCNVSEAAAAIGVETISVYALRRRDPVFFTDWGHALAQGYQLLETQLIGHLLAGGTRTDPVEQPGGGKTDVDTILRALTNHRAACGGDSGGGRARKTYGPAPLRASDADTDLAILKKLAAIEKARREKASIEASRLQDGSGA